MKYSAGICTGCGKTSFIVSHKGGKELCKKCNEAKLRLLKDEKATNNTKLPDKGLKINRKLKNGLKVRSNARSISWLTKELDKWFSRFIRLRDVKNGVVTCITCTKTGHPKDFDNGHFVGRQYKATRWNEYNCHAQCKLCNGYGEGEKYRYAQAIDKKVQPLTAEHLLDAMRYSKSKKSRFEYETLVQHYKTEVGKLLIEKQIKAWW